MTVLNATFAQSVALSPVLTTLYAEWSEAERPIDKKTAKAALEGACKAAHAVGICATPFEVFLVCQDAFRIFGARPVATAGNEARRTWTEAVRECIADNL